MAGRPAELNALAVRLTDELRALGDPDRAVGERAYLKSSYTHLGVAVPKVRGVATAYVRAARPGHDDVVALVEALWASEVYERRLLGVELVVATPTRWTVADLGWFERLVRDSHTWALVDPLATIAVARIAASDPIDPVALDVLAGWVGSDDMWVRRSSVLGLRDLARAGREWQRFEQAADVLLAEREFFVRKALGWVAREAGRRHPELVSPWVRANLDRMNAVTIREAVKYLPDGPELLVAWKRR
ncbi:MAG: DNA alkylation repair protein [Acidimicrobiales bacterium]|nr:DNA alkylation repair protein [Acidimicrobiales bacterium]